MRTHGDNRKATVRLVAAVLVTAFATLAAGCAAATPIPAVPNPGGGQQLGQ